MLQQRSRRLWVLLIAASLGLFAWRLGGSPDRAAPSGALSGIPASEIPDREAASRPAVIDLSTAATELLRSLEGASPEVGDRDERRKLASRLQAGRS